MTSTRPTAKTAASQRAAHSATQRRCLQWGIGIVVALALIGSLYAVFTRSSTEAASGGGYQIGQPGIGATAPAFTLAASTGKNVSLADYKGKTVLLYFQEGLTCQPCWDQLTDLEKAAPQVKAADIDQILSITSDPADLITQKVHDMGLTTPVLSDPNLTVSAGYHANGFGMMGTSRDGHTFILVGPTGTIEWRADYGGAPKYTMYVAPKTLLADLKAGEKK